MAKSFYMKFSKHSAKLKEIQKCFKCIIKRFFIVDDHQKSFKSKLIVFKKSNRVVSNVCLFVCRRAEARKMKAHRYDERNTFILVWLFCTASCGYRSILTYLFGTLVGYTNRKNFNYLK